MILAHLGPSSAPERGSAMRTKGFSTGWCVLGSPPSALFRWSRDGCTVSINLPVRDALGPFTGTDGRVTFAHLVPGRASSRLIFCEATPGSLFTELPRR